MPPSHDAVLISGTTGFVGAAVMARYLDQTDRPIIAPVRAHTAADADARLRTILHELYDEPTAEAHARRCTAIAADLLRPRLGLGPSDREEIARRTSEVIHCAASVSFELLLPEARAVNTAGARRMTQLAEVCSVLGDGLSRHVHVSTAYVAGDHEGAFREADVNASGRFRNTYEQTKHEAEAVVRSWTELPTQIVRPSIVVGSRSTGWTRAFNVLYWPLRMFCSGRLPVVPAVASSPVDVVPVDYVADGLLALGQAPPGTYHLVAGEDASSVGEIIDLAARRFELPEPALVPPDTFDAIDPASVSDSQRRTLERARVFFPYFSVDVRFTDAATSPWLRAAGVRSDPLPAYFDRLMDYAQRAQWGRAPLHPRELSLAA